MPQEKVLLEVIGVQVLSEADTAAVFVIHFDDDSVGFREPTIEFMLLLLPLSLERLLAELTLEGVAIIQGLPLGYQLLHLLREVRIRILLLELAVVLTYQL